MKMSNRETISHTNGRLRSGMPNVLPSISRRLRNWPSIGTTRSGTSNTVASIVVSRTSAMEKIAAPRPK